MNENRKVKKLELEEFIKDYFSNRCSKTFTKPKISVSVNSIQLKVDIEITDKSTPSYATSDFEDLHKKLCCQEQTSESIIKHLTNITRLNYAYSYSYNKTSLSIHVIFTHEYDIMD